VSPSSKAASSILPGDPALPIELSSIISSFTPSDEQSPSDQPSVSNNPILDPVPIVRCVDKPSSSLPSQLTLTEDIIRSSVGFRCIDTIKRFLPHLYQDTIQLDTSPPDAVLDVGAFATLPKQPRNTSPIT